jgi:ubiquinol-cytochrome c reductase iron-sulfur subunit
MLAGLGLTVVYVRGGQVQLEGALLALALGGIGLGLMAWAGKLLPQEQITEERELGPSPSVEREAAEEALESPQLARRTFLVRMLVGALGALGVAAVFPIRSLGPRPGRSLLRTPWARGLRLIKDDGTPVRRDDLAVGSVVTVFPEGSPDSGDAQALLIRVPTGSLRLPPARLAWAPEGYVCYSKVCTHAGCPVGLYRAAQQQLICPCHQSTFDVSRGAKPVFGPATRPLPQLPLTIDEEGYLRALGDFREPVGPGFWDRPS